MASQQDISYIASKLKMLSQEYPDNVPDDEQRIYVTSLQRDFYEIFCVNVDRYIVCFE